MVLHLRKEEAKIFRGLPKDLQDGWKVAEEKGTSDERPEELMMRYQMASFDHPSIRAFIKSVQGAKSVGEIEKAAASFDLTSLPQEQAAELFFVLGTNLMGRMIQYLLPKAAHDKDLEGLAALTLIRHFLLEANASASLSTGASVS